MMKGRTSFASASLSEGGVTEGDGGEACNICCAEDREEEELRTIQDENERNYHLWGPL